MRITTDAKQRTRARILARAQDLFEVTGYHGTSTRDLAAAAGIASGTLFNYFASKEDLAMTLVERALERGEAGFRHRRRGAEDLQEDLFAHVAAGLRELEPQRAYLSEVCEAALSPFSRGDLTSAGEAVRIRHLETVTGLVEQHGHAPAFGFVSVHLYWTLFLGVLAYWSRDESAHQADTLVVLDESLRAYVMALHSARE
jgi:AcrR family transcriptional regulator